MSITNFEEITYDLTENELALVNILVAGFKRRAIDNPIKAPEIVDSMQKKGYDISEPRLRKLCNYIRSKGIIPLIATSKGYYISYDSVDINKQIKSLRERAAAINKCADGLMKFIK